MNGIIKGIKLYKKKLKTKKLKFTLLTCTMEIANVIAKKYRFVSVNIPFKSSRSFSVKPEKKKKSNQISLKKER